MVIILAVAALVLIYQYMPPGLVRLLLAVLIGAIIIHAIDQGQG